MIINIKTLSSSNQFNPKLQNQNQIQSSQDKSLPHIIIKNKIQNIANKYMINKHRTFHTHLPNIILCCVYDLNLEVILPVTRSIINSNSTLQAPSNKHKMLKNHFPSTKQYKRSSSRFSRRPRMEIIDIDLSSS